MMITRTVKSLHYFDDRKIFSRINRVVTRKNFLNASFTFYTSLKLFFSLRYAINSEALIK